METGPALENKSLGKTHRDCQDPEGIVKSPLPPPNQPRQAADGVQGRVCPPRRHAADRRVAERQQQLVPSLLGVSIGNTAMGGF